MGRLSRVCVGAAQTGNFCAAAAVFFSGTLENFRFFCYACGKAARPGAGRSGIFKQYISIRRSHHGKAAHAGTSEGDPRPRSVRSSRRPSHSGDRRRRRAHPRPLHGAVRHGHPHHGLGRLVQASHCPAGDARPRDGGRHRGHRPERDRPQGGRPGLLRVPHRLRLLLVLQKRAGPHLPGSGAVRVQRGRRVRRVRVHSRVERDSDQSGNRRGRGGVLRRVRQRHAHRADVRRGGRGRADHRRGLHRHDGRRDLPPQRRAHRRGDRRERLSSGNGEEDGRDRGRQRRARED